jgi:serine/threonine-protein kinase RsbT
MIMDETAADGGEQPLAIEVGADVVRVRQLVRTYVEQVRLTDTQRVKAVTAASELARNTLIHGGGGQVTVQIIWDRGRRGVRMTFTDEGPGIADLEQAFVDGHSTRGSLGLGLPGARRLTNEFTVDTSEAGTVITAVVWENA